MTTPGSNPVAVVTGASRGIGKQLCVDLAQAGYDIVCAARSARDAPGRLPGTIDDTARLVERHERRAMPVAVDVQNEPAVATLAERLYAEWGRCDLLINNAAIAPPKPALQDSIKRWRLAVDVNLNGPFYLMYHLCGRMAAAGGGRVINISSGASQLPDFGRPSYMATKLALEGLTRALAHELHGRVAVNCIRIDFLVWSEGFEATLPGDYDTAAFEDPVVVSDAVRWLANQDLSYTGEILTLGELRESGVVRPQTTVRRS
jgi:NAD(P)-dependent dehydrogenase (short-subunit alcohol dehydrogenase family)